MGRLTELVLRHRRLVGVIWLLAVLVGGYASSVLSSHLSMSFEIPGTGSDIADSAIVARYGNGGSTTPLVPVIKLPARRPSSRKPGPRSRPLSRPQPRSAFPQAPGPVASSPTPAPATAASYPLTVGPRSG